jgi:translation initiation factor IF-2
MEVATYTPAEAPVPEGTVVIERASTPQEIGPKINRTAADVVRFLMQQGEMVTATQSLSDDMIELFAAEIGVEIRLVDPGEEKEVELQKLLDVDVFEDDEDDEDAEDRPPVITVMGHVDHGKTKLLDRIRNANVVEGEAGGITQHIGAYQATHEGRPLTFIDTPGHEAFTAMRARGADATDIVVLVVAADDGVMPQTIEAINHAKAAEVPIVVAVNKIDREAANPDRVLQQLSDYDLVPEQWGGDTVTCQISALQGLGIDELLENLLVVAELEDLRSNSEGRARGVVLESHLDKGRGPVATVLVQRGTLAVGDPLVAGPAWGRVRALIDDHGEQVKEAGPSVPVQVLGLSDVAMAGDEFIIAPDERVAAKVAETREHYHRVATLGREAHAMSGGAKLEDVFASIQAGEAATLNLVLKADVNGSLEALTESLRKLERDDVRLAFLHRGVGGITKSDIQLAAAANGTIIGFNVRPDRQARELADAEQVEIRSYEIIYEVLDDIEKAMLGMLAPEYEEVVTGEAEVREIFRVPRVGAVAGCYVQSGTITRGSKVRFLREGVVIWKGSITSLKRFKEDAREVQAGFECGIGLSDFQDLKPGDVIETFEEREIPRS